MYRVRLYKYDAYPGLFFGEWRAEDHRRYKNIFRTGVEKHSQSYNFNIN